MSVRYWVLASDELMRSGPQWPDGLRPTGVTEFRSIGIPVDADMGWYQFEDDTAPPELENKKVELTFFSDGSKVTGFRREVV